MFIGRLRNHHCCLFFFNKRQGGQACIRNSKIPSDSAPKAPSQSCFPLFQGKTSLHLRSSWTSVLGVRGNGEWYTRDVLCSVTLCVNCEILNVKKAYRAEPWQSGSKKRVCSQKNLGKEDLWIMLHGVFHVNWVQHHCALVVILCKVWVQTTDPRRLQSLSEICKNLRFVPDMWWSRVEW